MLNLRELNITQYGGSSLGYGPSDLPTDVVFASRIVGNLGAPLDFGQDAPEHCESVADPVVEDLVRQGYEEA